MTKEKRILFITYIIGHFMVDFACAFLLYRMLYGTDLWYPCLLYYNFCAFALQLPIGLLADRWNRNSLCADVGCILIILAIWMGSLGSAFKNIEAAVILIPAVLIAGIGNGLFHVGAGIDVLNVSRDKSFPKKWHNILYRICL